MAESPVSPPSPSSSQTIPRSVNPRSGFDGVTKTFRSLRPAVTLPLPFMPLSATSYAFSLLPCPLPSNPAIVDAATGAAVSFPDLLSQSRSLAASLRTHLGLSKGHVAFIVSPNRLEIPALYLALFSLGAVAAPANPTSTPTEIAGLVRLSNPAVAFALSSTAAALPRHLPTLLLDSPEFASFLTSSATSAAAPVAEVCQSDVAAILFSSGTTGPVKAAALTHRSFIAMVAAFYAMWRKGRLGSGGDATEVTLLAAPMFHTMGFVFALKGVALGATTVLMGSGRAGIAEMLRAAEQYRVTGMTATPPVVVAMGRLEVAAGLDLSALKRVVCGGAPLHPSAAQRFMARFPSVDLSQVHRFGLCLLCVGTIDLFSLLAPLDRIPHMRRSILNI